MRSKSFNPTPLSICFPADWKENPDWEKLAPQKMKDAWMRRLSWRAQDSALEKFLHFLEKNGAETTLDNASWHKTMDDAMHYRSCRQTLFILIKNHMDTDGFLGNMKIRDGIKADFLKWKKSWEQDERLAEQIHEACNNEEIRRITRFRGIALCEAVTYPAYQIICRQTQDK